MATTTRTREWSTVVRGGEGVADAMVSVTRNASWTRETDDTTYRYLVVVESEAGESEAGCDGWLEACIAAKDEAESLRTEQAERVADAIRDKVQDALDTLYGEGRESEVIAALRKAGLMA